MSADPRGDRSEPVAAGPPWASGLVVAGGLLVVIEGLLWGEIPLAFIGLFLFVMAFFLRTDPDHHLAHGAMTLVVVFLSLFFGHGGFYAGAILAAAGGTLAIIWKPPAADSGTESAG